VIYTIFVKATTKLITEEVKKDYPIGEDLFNIPSGMVIEDKKVEK
jgi:hypothetical protein